MAYADVGGGALPDQSFGEDRSDDMIHTAEPPLKRLAKEASMKKASKPRQSRHFSAELPVNRSWGMVGGMLRNDG